MSTFKIGEHALVLPGPTENGLEKYIGTVVEVVGAAVVHYWPEHSYPVQAQDGRRFWSKERGLQKLPPLREDLTRTTWASVPDFRRITAPKREEVLA